MEIITAALQNIYADSKRWIKLFKGDTYEAALASFQKEYEELLAQVQNIGEEGAAETAAEFVRTAKTYLDGIEKRPDRENKQLELNMLMAVYLIPALREDKEEKMLGLTEQICKEWSNTFSNGKIKAGDYSSISAGFKKKMCYITTAVCESMHKPEDCYELNLLRSYRDDYMSKTEEGRALIAKYYDVAPTIVKRIGKSENPSREYSRIWEQYLKPCISMIEAGDKSACQKQYVEMVENLHKQYMEEYYV